MLCWFRHIHVHDGLNSTHAYTSLFHPFIHLSIYPYIHSISNSFYRVSNVNLLDSFFAQPQNYCKFGYSKYSYGFQVVDRKLQLISQSLLTDQIASMTKNSDTWGILFSTLSKHSQFQRIELALVYWSMAMQQTSLFQWTSFSTAWTYLVPLRNWHIPNLGALKLTMP